VLFEEIPPTDRSDVNGDGKLSAADVSALLELFGAR